MKRLLIIALGLFSTVVQAQGFPDRPLTIIVPAGAGGGGDTTTRLLARGLEEELGQPITIVNQGQGGGVVGLTSIKNAKPDGYTVGLLFPYAGYHYTGQADFSLSDFTPIANFNGDSSALFTAANSDFDDASQAVDALRQSPADYTTHCSGACGSVWDVPVASLLLDEGVDVARIRWIPGKGAASGLSELVSGGVDFLTASLPEASSMIDAGLVRPLTVLSPEPVDGFTSVPLAGELTGSPVDGGTWRALGGPKGMPEEAAKVWEEAVLAVTDSEAFKKAMSQAGFGVRPFDAEGLRNLMKTHEEDTARVMRALGYGK
ncbi:Bug family tripartite tricarboxylate transporter substrate binding protein [Modicisalibacter radicis]|uniref:Bug family tripartite tricarboxylate transporter substrate binding protein n=1 Tax=Halomonas sp. EAR18 TaxID=2518972 RepID=UPI00109D7E30|nr:tripartite tricarboxylate transporter substrate binding protein [Halomonas sp. EAR18]